MTNQTNNTEIKDISLSEVSTKVKGYFSRVNDSLFDGILFIKKYIIAIAVIVLLGAGYGYYKDSNDTQFETKVFVVSNFGSADYLYQQIENLNSKIYNPEFKKATGVNESNKLVRLKVEPVLDIYNFINNPYNDKYENDRNYEVFRLISENGDMKKVVKDDLTSRNFNAHVITITTTGFASEEKDIRPVITYLNSNPYFKSLQVEGLKSLDIKLALNDSTIKQIDGILNSFPETAAKGTGVVLNDHADISEVINLKERLLKEQALNRVNKINYTSIIKDSSMALNMSDGSMLTGNMKYIVPLMLLLAFVVVVRFTIFYKKQVNKRKLIITAE
jgi:hypothetical protein